MSDWASGYVTDIGYTFGYYHELNPQFIKLSFLNQGLAFPDVGTACELGFGQGLSVNIHAAASITQWHGTDFNPSQVGFAQELTAASASGAKLYDDAFAEFAHRADLPDFDFIALHGIWSWISDANRQVIADFIRRKLKVGGVLYISYNTLPGWGAFAPIRHLMTEHAAVLGTEGHGITSQIDSALEFVDNFTAVNPSYFRANPQIGERIKGMKPMSRQYLAHEYFNRDWQPMHFATMKEWLTGSKLQFACSAHFLDHIDAVNLTPEQQAFLQNIPDNMFRETARDFVVNQQFRRDYWVKGIRTLSALDRATLLRSQKVVLITPRQDVPLKVNGSLGEATLSEAIYAPILDLLSDHRPRTIGQIEIELKDKNINFSQIVQTVMVLMGAKHICPATDDTGHARLRKQTERLNNHLCLKARSSNDVSFLASPVTGGGIPVSRFQQLFLLSMNQGRKQPAEWANFAWAILSSQGQALIKDGKTLASAGENLDELNRQAMAFAEKQLPVLKALQIA